MKLLKGRLWISIVAVLILILLGWIVWQNARAFEPYETTKRFTVMLEGTYSIDGGEWQTIDNDKTIDEHFHKAVFKGKMIPTVKKYRMMNIISKNVWYTIYDSNGEIISQGVETVWGSHFNGYDTLELGFYDKTIFPRVCKARLFVA